MQKDEDVGRMTMSAPAAVAAAAERFAEQLLEKAAEVRDYLRCSLMICIFQAVNVAGQQKTLQPSHL